MCGRFTFQIPPELLVELFGLRELPAIFHRYNIAPTQRVPAIRQGTDGVNRLDLLRWGLIPSWAKDASVGARMINARSETVGEKPAFRQAIRYRRCLLPASGFYEWKQEGKLKQPWHICLKDGVPMLFAGIWESWDSGEGETVESCSILTTAANALVAPLHDRMPVILTPDDQASWLDRQNSAPPDLARLYRSYPADLMECWPVSPAVNNVRNEAPELVCRQPAEFSLT